VNAFLRLIAYARPYRGRLTAAAIAMIVYGAASAGVAALIQPILDRVLPRHEELAQIISAILILYLIKGVGAYLSGYLMTDVGQRVVRDLRNLLFTHILGQSAAFFSSQTSGKLMSRITNDVAQIQQAVSETLGDLARESLSLVGFAALLFYYDARLAVVCLTGAPLVVYPLIRLGQRVRRTTRRSQEALAQITHVSAEAFTGHRIVKAFGAEQRETEKFRAASDFLYRTSMKVTTAPVRAASVNGVHRRRRIRRGALVRQPGDQRPAPDDGRVRRLHCRIVHDVRSGEEIEPRQRQSPAGDCGRGAHFRDARHAQRSPRAGGRRAVGAIP
jgi:subfamily B ATP-binding cassette protein MsbA